jgi:hypothetical protein
MMVPASMMRRMAARQERGASRRPTFRAALMFGVLFGGLFGVLCSAACATTTSDGTNASGEIVRASDATLEVVRRSPVQRFVREAPTVVRSGIAKLVTMVPLDDKKMARLAPAVAAAFFVERLETETALRLEKALTPAEIASLADALQNEAVAAVITGAVSQVPEGKALERFVEDPRALGEERRARVRALVEASWSPSIVDRLTRAPVAAAGRCVAAAVRDDDDGRRTELLRIAEHGRASDPDALVVAFAFLWRDIDDAAIDEAQRFFSSQEGRKAHHALLEAAVNAVDELARQVERDVSR